MRRWLPNKVARASLLLFLACGSNNKDATGGAVGTGHDSDGGEPVIDAGHAAARDASTYDTKLYDGDHYLCGYDQNDKSAFSGNSSLRLLASATDERGFALVHLDAVGNLFIEGLPVGGDADAPVALLNANEHAEAATLVANGQHFLLAWRAAGDAQSLRTRELSGDGAGVVEHSATLAHVDGGGELFAASALGDGFALVFIEQGEGGAALRTKQLDASGRAIGTTQTLDDIATRSPEHLQLARTDDGGSLLAWLERDSAGAGKVMALPLTATLTPKPMSSQSQLSKNAVAESVFGLAARTQSEGLIYHAKDGDTRDTVKYRRVEPSGLSTQAVLNVVDAPARARDGSIAPFGQGYAVAYRKLPSLGDSKASVHVAFVNQYGESVYDAELAESSEDPAPTTVSATADGHVFVAWTNALPGSATTSALRLYCPGALVLCGGTK